MDRIVIQSEPEPDVSHSGTVGSFQQYVDIHNVILLGDPGLGKTHLFESCSKNDGSKFISVRNFYATRGKGCKGKTVFLDGLDEYRSRLKDKNMVLEIISILEEIGRPKLRISCRELDWRGESDLSVFRNYFLDDSYAVLSLQPLQLEEISSILSGRSIDRPEDFIREAQRQNVSPLLENPQTLLMLADTVSALGMWPKSKTEVYEKATLLLLEEHNSEQSDTELGEYCAEELISAAGAISASILIADVAGVSLIENSRQHDTPTYRKIPREDQRKLQACLSRRAFKSIDSTSQAFSYIHRTIAEFLGAKWLVDQIRNGYPIERILSLITIDNHPANELRGLHAWLATLLSEHGARLIPNDPFGVLMYGDASAMSASNRRIILEQLEILAERDPWFRANNFIDHPLGALSGPDMAESFEKVLNNSASSFHLRDLVLGALINGPEMPSMKSALENLIKDSEAPYGLRSDAVTALLKIVPNGKIAVIGLFRDVLEKDATTSRLRQMILVELYEDNFNADDVVSIYEDMANDPNERSIGSLWPLAESLPVDSLPQILDKLCLLLNSDKFKTGERDLYEIESSFSQILARILPLEAQFDLEQYWLWLKTAYMFRREGYSSRGKDSITDWLDNNHETVATLIWFAIEDLDHEGREYLLIHKFIDITQHTLNYFELLEEVFNKFSPSSNPDEKNQFLYKLCIALSFRSGEKGSNIFYELMDISKDIIEYKNIINESLSCELQDWWWEERTRKSDFEEKKEKQRIKNKRNFEKVKDSVRSGANLNWLGYLAQIYFEPFSDGKAQGYDRLQESFGSDLAFIAINGFKNLVYSMNDFPNLEEIACPSSRPYWWLAVLAGLDEVCIDGEQENRISDDLLKVGLAIHMEWTTQRYDRFTNSLTRTKRKWVDGLFENRVDIVVDTLKQMISPALANNYLHSAALYELTGHKDPEPWRSQLAFDLLKHFPKTHNENLYKLMLASTVEMQHYPELLKLANQTLQDRYAVKMQRRALWLILGFVLDMDIYAEKLKSYFKAHDWVVWMLISVVNRSNFLGEKGFDLTTNQLYFIIDLVGCKYPNQDRPNRATTGHKNAWDAAEFVQRKITYLSTIPTNEATTALTNLLAIPKLSSYFNLIKHSLANQKGNRREAEYEQPSWEQAITTLSGGSPANIADLHALVLHHLSTLKIDIRNSSTDKFEAFWRCDKKGNVDEPEIEDICRNRLIDYLRPFLNPLGLNIEPEGHMVNAKRADIIITAPGLKLPLELKRENHADVWTACMNQLDRLYTRDPDAQGYGIYLVFWFGIKIKSPPKSLGIQKPVTAQELEHALTALIPEEKNHCLDAVVLDVSA